MLNDKENILLSELECLVEAEKIKKVLYTYCQAADRCDAEIMKSCYCADSYDDHGFFCGSGWNFVDYVIPELKKLKMSIHSLTNINITVDLESGTATSICQWSVVHRIKRFFGYTDIWDNGRYLDKFVKEGGTWKISKRIVVMDGERWFNTVNLLDLVPAKTPNKVYEGGRLTEDPTYKFDRLFSCIRAPFEMKNLWRPYYFFFWTPKLLIHFLGKKNRHGKTIS